MTDITTAISGDVTKALEAVAVAIPVISAAQASLTNDQHQDVVTKALDLLHVATPSVAALESAGVIGHNDAANAQKAITAVENVAPAVSLWTTIVNAFRSAFSWIP